MDKTQKKKEDDSDKKEKKLSPEELIESTELKKAEEECLLRVWKHLTKYDKTKPDKFRKDGKD